MRRKNERNERRALRPTLALAMILAATAARALPALQDRAFVLCWHTFLGTKGVGTDFSLDELGRQIDTLLALGYRFIGLEDLLFGRFEGGMNLVATIDDGHRTVAEACSREFAARGIAPALFIFPAVIGKSSPYLDLDELRSLRDAGSPIGAHGYYHLYLTESLYKRERPVFDKEIYGAKDKLEAQTGLPAYAFAYPFGVQANITKQEVAKAGYAFGLSVKPGYVYADARLNDPYELPRTVVTKAAWPEILAFLTRNARSVAAAPMAAALPPLAFGPTALPAAHSAAGLAGTLEGEENLQN